MNKTNDDLVFVVEVEFFSSARALPPRAGYKGQVDLGKVQTSCSWSLLEPNLDEFCFDQKIKAVLRPMFPSQYGELFQVGREFPVREGPLQVGHVKIIDKCCSSNI